MEKTLSPDTVVLLCGGNGTRMGAPKGLLTLDGRPWLTHQLERVQAAGIDRVILVLGHQAEAYMAAAPWHGLTELVVEIVTNPDPDRGQFSSLLCGLAVASEAVFVLPVDVPCPARETWQRLAEAHIGSIMAVLPECGGRGGHPILVSAEFAHRLRSVPVDSVDARLDKQMHKLSHDEVVRVPVDDATVTTNMNTPADWALSKAR